ncbi:MAG: hypothetical protein IJ637_06290 [Prevotella sp.]|nr:hypothetical protein [Prevotella sp.]
MSVLDGNETADYIFTGVGYKLLSASDALADATATSIDATGITAATALTTANPNCLITANAGMVTNANNVIVSGACAQLALTDNKPFKAPAAFSATAAPTYDRAFTASQTTTVCLPFALTSAEAATLGTFYELSSFDGSTLHFAEVAAPAANTPYFVVPTATALTLSETGKSIAATPATIQATHDNVDFIGTMESATIPASDATYSYYAYNNGALVKIATNAATLPAFRGYFKVLNTAITAGAPVLNISFGDADVTAVKTVGTAQRAKDGVCYNMNGQRVSQPAKGLYIVNGKKVIVK